MNITEEITPPKRASYRKNREKYLKQMSDYKKRNRDKMNEYVRAKIRNDESFAISNRMRVKLHDVLNLRYSDKASIRLFGCDRAQLMAHLESQFKPGMDWSNHTKNGWHIDHILPVCSFDLTDEVQKNKCWHYTNMRPAWADENRRKNRYGNNPNPK